MQLNDDSHPLDTTPSLLNLLFVQEERTVQVDGSEQAVHPEMALQSYHDSHPLDTTPSLLNLHFVQEEIIVQVEESEQAVHVALSTVMALQSNEDSHPLNAIPSISNLPFVQDLSIQTEPKQLLQTAFGIEIAEQPS